MNADTAIVSNGAFFHYCHKTKALMAWRIHHQFCPLCLQKNPDYISNKLIYTVTDMLTTRVVMTFVDIYKAVQYMQDHPNDNLALGDTGYVK